MTVDLNNSSRPTNEVPTMSSPLYVLLDKNDIRYEFITAASELYGLKRVQLISAA